MRWKLHNQYGFMCEINRNHHPVIGEIFSYRKRRMIVCAYDQVASPNTYFNVIVADATPLKIKNLRVEPVAFTLMEGGTWIPWTKPQLHIKHIHAVMFADGSVLDTHNGWRSK